MNTRRGLASHIRSALYGVTPLLGSLIPALALAGPTGEDVIAGGVSVARPDALSTLVTQTTQNAIVNWQSFNLGADEIIQFLQPSSSSVILNRVVGGSPTSIFGDIQANGRVFLVNPLGVYFAPGAQLDVGGLVASTLDIADQDFLSGDHQFVRGSSAPAAGVVNEGTLSASPGGFVVLAGDYTRNDGVITAQAGTVVLAAGSRLTFDLVGDGLVNFAVDEATVADLAGVSNTGVLEGGTVFMTARVANQLAATVVNNSGVVRAATIEDRGGEIWLAGAGGGVSNSGTLDASGTTGGTVGVIGTGDVDLDPGSVVAADGTAGDGGTVRAIAGGRLDFTEGAAISATGGGGFVEVSGHGSLSLRGAVTVPDGTLLIDPTSLTITAGGAGAGGNSTSATVGDQFIEGQLNANTNVRLVASSTITAATGADITATTGNGNLTIEIGTITAPCNLGVCAGSSGSFTVVPGGTVDLDNISINMSGTLTVRATNAPHASSNSLDIPAMDGTVLLGAVTAGAINIGTGPQGTGATVTTGALTATTGGIVVEADHAVTVNGAINAANGNAEVRAAFGNIDLDDVSAREILIGTGFNVDGESVVTGNLTATAGGVYINADHTITVGNVVSTGTIPTPGGINLFALDLTNNINITTGSLTVNGVGHIWVWAEALTAGAAHVSIGGPITSPGDVKLQSGAHGASNDTSITVNGGVTAGYNVDVFTAAQGTGTGNITITGMVTASGGLTPVDLLPRHVNIFADFGSSDSGGGTISVGGITAVGVPSGSGLPLAAAVDLRTNDRSITVGTGGITVIGIKDGYTNSAGPFGSTSAGSAGIAEAFLDAGAAGTVIVNGDVNVTGAGEARLVIDAATVTFGTGADIVVDDNGAQLTAFNYTGPCVFSGTSACNITETRTSGRDGGAEVLITGALDSATASVTLNNVTATGPSARIEITGSDITTGHLTATGSGRLSDERTGAFSGSQGTGSYTQSDTYGPAAVRLTSGQQGQAGSAITVNGSITVQGVGAATLDITADTVSVTGSVGVAAFSDTFTHTGDTFGLARSQRAGFLPVAGLPGNLVSGTQVASVATVTIGQFAPPSSSLAAPAPVNAASVQIDGGFGVGAFGDATITLHTDDLTIGSGAGITISAAPATFSGIGLDISLNPVAVNHTTGGVARLDIQGGSTVNDVLDLGDNVIVTGPAAEVAIQGGMVQGGTAAVGAFAPLSGDLQITALAIDLSGLVQASRTAQLTATGTGGSADINLGIGVTASQIDIQATGTGNLSLGAVTANDTVSLQSALGSVTTSTISLNDPLGAATLSVQAATGIQLASLTAAGVGGGAGPAVDVELTSTTGNITVSGGLSLTGNAGAYSGSFSVSDPQDALMGFQSGTDGSVHLDITSTDTVSVGGALNVTAAGEGLVTLVAPNVILTDVSVLVTGTDRTTIGTRTLCDGAACAVSFAETETTAGRAAVLLGETTPTATSLVNVSGAVSISGPTAELVAHANTVHFDSTITVAATGLDASGSSTGTIGATPVAFDYDFLGGFARVDLGGTSLGSTTQVSGTLTVTANGFITVQATADNITLATVALTATPGGDFQLSGDPASTDRMRGPFVSDADDFLPDIESGQITGGDAILRLEGTPSGSSNVHLDTITVSAPGTAAVVLRDLNTVVLGGAVSATASSGTRVGTRTETFHDPAANGGGGANFTITETVNFMGGLAMIDIETINLLGNPDLTVSGPMAGIRVDAHAVNTGSLAASYTGATIDFDVNIDSDVNSLDQTLSLSGPTRADGIVLLGVSGISVNGDVTLDGAGYGEVIIRSSGSGPSVVGDVSVSVVADDPYTTFDSLTDTAPVVDAGGHAVVDIAGTSNSALITGDLSIDVAGDLGLGLGADVTGMLLAQAGGSVLATRPVLGDRLRGLTCDPACTLPALSATSVSAGAVAVSGASIELGSALFTVGNLGLPSILFPEDATVTTLLPSVTGVDAMFRTTGLLDLGGVNLAGGDYLQLFAGSFGVIENGLTAGTGDVVQVSLSGAGTLAFDQGHTGAAGVFSMLGQVGSLAGANLVLGQTGSTNPIQVGSTTPINLGTNSLTLISNGAITSGTGLLTASSLTLRGSGAGSVNLLTNIGAFDLGTVSSFTIDNSAYTGNLTFALPAGATSGSLTTGGDLALSGAFNGTTLSLSTPGSLSHTNTTDTLTASTSVSLTVGGHLALEMGSGSATGRVITPVLNYTGDADSSAYLDADVNTLNLTGGSGIVLGLAEYNAGAGTTVNLSGGSGALEINTAQDLTLTGSFTGQTAALYANTMVLNANLTTGSGGGIQLQAGGNVSGSGLVTGPYVVLSLQGNTQTASLNTAAQSLTLGGGQSMNINNSAATGDVTFDTTSAAPNLTLNTGGSSAFFGQFTGNTLNITAPGDLAFVRATALTGITLNVGGDARSINLDVLTTPHLTLSGSAASSFRLNTVGTNTLIVGNLGTLELGNNNAALSVDFNNTAPLTSLSLHSAGTLTVVDGLTAVAAEFSGTTLNLGAGPYAITNGLWLSATSTDASVSGITAASVLQAGALTVLSGGATVDLDTNTAALTINADAAVTVDNSARTGGLLLTLADVQNPLTGDFDITTGGTLQVSSLNANSAEVGLTATAINFTGGATVAGQMALTATTGAITAPGVIAAGGGLYVQASSTSDVTLDTQTPLLAVLGGQIVDIDNGAQTGATQVYLLGTDLTLVNRAQSLTLNTGGSVGGATLTGFYNGGTLNLTAPGNLNFGDAVTQLEATNSIHFSVGGSIELVPIVLLAPTVTVTGGAATDFLFETNAANLVVNSGRIVAITHGITPSLTVDLNAPLQDLALSTTGTLSFVDGFDLSGDADLSARSIVFGAGTYNADGSVSLEAYTGSTAPSSFTGTATLNAGSLVIHALPVTTVNLVTNTAAMTLNSGSTVSLNNSAYTGTTALALTLGDSTLAPAQRASMTNLSVTSGSGITLASASLIFSGTDLTLNAGGVLSLLRAINATGTVSLTATDWTQSGSQILTAPTLELAISGATRSILTQVNNLVAHTGAAVNIDNVSTNPLTVDVSLNTGLTNLSVLTDGALTFNGGFTATNATLGFTNLTLGTGTTSVTNALTLNPLGNITSLGTLDAPSLTINAAPTSVVTLSTGANTINLNGGATTTITQTDTTGAVALRVNGSSSDFVFTTAGATVDLTWSSITSAGDLFITAPTLNLVANGSNPVTVRTDVDTLNLSGTSTTYDIENASTDALTVDWGVSEIFGNVAISTLGALTVVDGLGIRNAITLQGASIDLGAGLYDSGSMTLTVTSGDLRGPTGTAINADSFFITASATSDVDLTVSGADFVDLSGGNDMTFRILAGVTTTGQTRLRMPGAAMTGTLTITSTEELDLVSITAGSIVVSAVHLDLLGTLTATGDVSLTQNSSTNTAMGLGATAITAGGGLQIQNLNGGFSLNNATLGATGTLELIASGSIQAGSGTQITAGALRVSGNGVSLLGNLQVSGTSSNPNGATDALLLDGLDNADPSLRPVGDNADVSIVSTGALALGTLNTTGDYVYLSGSGGTGFNWTALNAAGAVVQVVFPSNGSVLTLGAAGGSPAIPTNLLSSITAETLVVGASNMPNQSFVIGPLSTPNVENFVTAVGGSSAGNTLLLGPVSHGGGLVTSLCSLLGGSSCAVTNTGGNASVALSTIAVGSVGLRVFDSGQFTLGADLIAGEDAGGGDEADGSSQPDGSGGSGGTGGSSASGESSNGDGGSAGRSSEASDDSPGAGSAEGDEGGGTSGESEGKGKGKGKGKSKAGSGRGESSTSSGDSSAQVQACTAGGGGGGAGGGGFGGGGASSAGGGAGSSAGGGGGGGFSAAGGLGGSATGGGGGSSAGGASSAGGGSGGGGLGGSAAGSGAGSSAGGGASSGGGLGGGLGGGSASGGAGGGGLGGAGGLGGGSASGGGSSAGGGLGNSAPSKTGGDSTGSSSSSAGDGRADIVGGAGGAGGNGGGRTGDGVVVNDRTTTPVIDLGKKAAGAAAARGLKSEATNDLPPEIPRENAPVSGGGQGGGQGVGQGVGQGNGVRAALPANATAGKSSIVPAAGLETIRTSETSSTTSAAKSPGAARAEPRFSGNPGGSRGGAENGEGGKGQAAPELRPTVSAGIRRDSAGRSGGSSPGGGRLGVSTRSGGSAGGRLGTGTVPGRIGGSKAAKGSDTTAADRSGRADAVGKADERGSDSTSDSKKGSDSQQAEDENRDGRR